MINALTHIKGLQVAARTSAFSFKGKDVHIGEIGRKPKVDKVLEGSVRTAGNKLRVTAQLINVEDGYHIWSERYDRELEDVFDIQDEITQSIVDELRLKLEINKESIQEMRQKKNLKVYHLYLKGRYFLYSRKAIQYYPDYVYALWILGHIYSLCSMHKEAIAAHQKILALTDRVSFYLGSMRMTYGLSGDLDKAKAILHELEERSQREYVPAFAIAHVWAGMKRPDQTFEWLEKAYNERAGMIWMVRMPLWDPLRSDPRFKDLLHRLNLNQKS